VFPLFIIEGLPAGLSGLIVAGVLAAAMSTVSSSLNSLASATTHDLYAPATRHEHDDKHLLRVGRAFTLVWAVILIGGAILFELAQQGTPIVVIALQIASFTFGPLLGGFLLGTLFRKPDQTDAITGIAAAVLVMTTLWAVQTFGVIEPVANTLWFALLGSALTVAVGLGSAAIRSR
jgi:SSS family solute:Na+ symporter